MAHALTHPCAVCGAPCNRWRQCPVKGCTHPAGNAAACDAHGGDDAAVAAMRAHLAVDHGRRAATDPPAQG